MQGRPSLLLIAIIAIVVIAAIAAVITGIKPKK
jgi:hypothetical protein